MRVIERTVYQFNELDDKAKEKVRDWWRSIPGCILWNDESLGSIEAFCSHFNVKLTDWEVGPYCPFYYKTNAKNANFRGLKLKDFNRDYCPTGYCLDFDLWSQFYDEFKNTGNAKGAFFEALNNAFDVWRKDMEYQLSDEYVDETLIINEYEFYENGERV